MPIHTAFRTISRLVALSTIVGVIAHAAPALAPAPASATAAATDEVPSWAFAVNPPTVPVPTAAASATRPDTTPQHVPASSAAYTQVQVHNLFAVPDWHPDGHPTMPGIVAHGRKPDVYACGYCHLPNGLGRPENAGLAGLPAAYIVQQVAEFGSGRRHSSEARHVPAALMVGEAMHADAGEVEAAARYFSSLKPQRWIRVVETATVPRTHVAGWMQVADGDGGAAAEPIGERIVEMAEDLGRTELRDDASGFVAYVPTGSLRRGEALVRRTPDRDAAPCTSCHGTDLRGQGDVPSIAGRSPSYIVRQLYDIRHGARSGEAVAPMQAPVARLDAADRIAVAAYLAALPP